MPRGGERKTYIERDRETEREREREREPCLHAKEIHGALLSKSMRHKAREKL